jgi:hypothetical protein
MDKYKVFYYNFLIIPLFSNLEDSDLENNKYLKKEKLEIMIIKIFGKSRNDNYHASNEIFTFHSLIKRITEAEINSSSPVNYF